MGAPTRRAALGPPFMPGLSSRALELAPARPEHPARQQSGTQGLPEGGGRSTPGRPTFHELGGGSVLYADPLFARSTPLDKIKNLHPEVRSTLVVGTDHDHALGLLI